jgi:hypothetical protein
VCVGGGRDLSVCLCVYQYLHLYLYLCLYVCVEVQVSERASEVQVSERAEGRLAVHGSRPWFSSNMTHGTRPSAACLLLAAPAPLTDCTLTLALPPTSLALATNARQGAQEKSGPGTTGARLAASCLALLLMCLECARRQGVAEVERSILWREACE